MVTQETSEEFGITSLSDLAENGADLTLGGPPDCETNPFCIPGLQDVYGRRPQRQLHSRSTPAR